MTVRPKSTSIGFGRNSGMKYLQTIITAVFVTCGPPINIDDSRTKHSTNASWIQVLFYFEDFLRPFRARIQQLLTTENGNNVDL